jgi:hypothetical protein
MIKTLKKLGIKGIKAKYNTYSQHYTKWRTTEIIPIKIRNKTGMPAFPTPFQYSFGITSQNNKTRARNKRDLNNEGRNQTISICR